MDMLDAQFAMLGSAEACPRPVEAAISLCELKRGVSARVMAVGSPGADAQLMLRLIEIGFVPGEIVRVVAHGQPGNEPIAVRLGGTTFALRRLEAGYIRVVPLEAGER